MIFGSNIFNLAFLLGFSAVVAGSLVCRRATILLNAAVALWVSVIVSLQIIYDIPPLVVGLLLVLVMLPYTLVSALKPHRLRWLRLPGLPARWLRDAVRDTEVDVRDERRPSAPCWADYAAVAPLLGVVVVGSIGTVRSATGLGERWGLSEVVIGALVLASLTGMPNVIAAVRLAGQGRGSAVVSETFNSNSLNLIVGVYMPTLVVAGNALSPAARLSLWWLLGMTLLASALFLLRGSLGRPAGLFLMAVYVDLPLSWLLTKDDRAKEFRTDSAAASRTGSWSRKKRNKHPLSS